MPCSPGSVAVANVGHTDPVSRCAGEWNVCRALLLEHAAQVRKLARRGLDEAEIGRVETDHRKAARGGHVARTAGCPLADERSAASSQRTFSTASSNPGDRGSPAATARTNACRALAMLKRAIDRPRRTAR